MNTKQEKPLEAFVKWFRDFLFYTLPGFVYLFAAYIFIQSFNHEPFIKLNKDYITFVAIAIVIFSYVLGIVMYLLVQLIIDLKKNYDEKKGKDISKYDILEFKKKSDERSYQSGRRNALLIRHLFLSLFCLFIALLFWYFHYKQPCINMWHIGACLILSLLCLLAYCQQTKMIKKNRDRLRKMNKIKNIAYNAISSV